MGNTHQRRSRKGTELRIAEHLEMVRYLSESPSSCPFVPGPSPIFPEQRHFRGSEILEEDLA
jgi:hypothetical protein